jgi:hypothetical protein
MTEHKSADQNVDIKLPSGETCHTSLAEALEVLKELLEWYGGQEKEWYEKTYRSGDSFNTGYEREWFRYRREAGGLQLAINLLSGEQT